MPVHVIVVSTMKHDTIVPLQEECTLRYNERKMGLMYSLTKSGRRKTRTMPAENNVYYFPELHFSV